MGNREDDDLGIPSIDPTPREDGQPGPPDSWTHPSWYDGKENDWWFRPPEGTRWQRDPCPVRPIGARDGEYFFVTPFGELRSFTASQLNSRGALSDLFGSGESWTYRHFRKFDAEKQTFIGSVFKDRCASALLRFCMRKGYYSFNTSCRRTGIWDGPDGEPVVHAGDRIFHAGQVHRPGFHVGPWIYLIGDTAGVPAMEVDANGLRFEWVPADASVGRNVSGHLDEWAWDTPEACELFQGALHCAMLGSWLKWLAHVFLEAPAGSGKSALLKYARALLGGASHDIQSNYTKAHFEQNFVGMACAFPIDEAERDSDPQQIQRLIEFVRLLSDGKASGGRGSASGKGRRIDVHGAVLMAATTTGDWLPQDRSRITLLELLPFRDRTNRSPAPPEVLEGIVAQADELSSKLRARALTRTALFLANLRVARASVMGMGGSPRDADQIGHLVAGYYTMIRDEPLAQDEDLSRYQPFIISINDADTGEDEPTELLNTLFGIAPDTWRSGHRPTVGQVIARAREENGTDARGLLPSYGLRLEKRGKELWDSAWLCVANKHPGLDELFARYPRYVGKTRKTILKQLRRTIDGQVWRAQPSGEKERLYFGGTQQRFISIPPVFLPTREAEMT